MSIQSIPRNAFPGDTVRIPTKPVESIDGETYPAGTEYQPRSAGHNNLSGQKIRQVTIAGQAVQFDTEVQP